MAAFPHAAKPWFGNGLDKKNLVLYDLLPRFPSLSSWLLPCLASPSSPRSSFFAPPCSLASLLAPRLARVLARALVPASVRVLAQASVPATVLPLALALDPGMAVIRVSLAFGCESLVPTS